MMAELLSLMHVADMHFDYRSLHSLDCIVNSYGSVGICTCIENDTIHLAESDLMDLIDYSTLVVALVVINLDILMGIAQLPKILFKRSRSIDTWFTFAQKIEIWSIDDQNSHNILVLVF